MTDELERMAMVRVAVDGGIAVATIDAPPINVMTNELYRELRVFGDAIAEREDVRVVVIRSADPDFFIAHFDVAALVEIPIDEPPAPRDRPTGFHRMCERFRTLPMPTIAEIDGRVGGGGHEFAMSLDMRFGTIGRTIVNQMEVPLGILPGGTGTQRLPELVGHGRAMEIVLAGDDIDAATADRWGLLNRALPPGELTPFVDALAARIAAMPPGAVRLAKQSILNAGRLDRNDALVEEARLFEESLRLPGTNERMREFLRRGGQTRDGELRIADLVAESGRHSDPRSRGDAPAS